MVISETLYDVLGAAHDATAAELRAAFRARARDTHPDAGGDAAAFRAVQAAWDVLGDERERAGYDRWLARLATMSAGSVAEETAPPAPEPDPDPEPFRQPWVTAPPTAQNVVDLLLAFVAGNRRELRVLGIVAASLVTLAVLLLVVGIALVWRLGLA